MRSVLGAGSHNPGDAHDSGSPQGSGNTRGLVDTRTPGWFDAMRIAYAAGVEAAARGASTSVSVESLPLFRAAGRTLASDLRATFDVPHYSSAAMDGFAVAGDPPWQLDEAGPTKADPNAPLLPGRARTIVTGGRVPEGASGVVRVEYTTTDREQSTVRMTPESPTSEVEPGRHIRPAGREAATGDLIAAAGRPLTPPLLAMAAICGYDDLPVRPAVTAALLLTGDEVRTSGVPAPGEVRDAFEVQLPHVLRAAGVDVVEVRRIGDDRQTTTDAVEQLADVADVVITTGGTGRSAADHVRAALERAAGARVIVEELAMRPGHPTMLAVFERAVELPQMDGAARTPATAPAGTARLVATETARSVPVLALPGNPLAAMAAMRVVGTALLRGLRGADPEAPLTVPVAQDLPAEKVGRLTPAAPAATDSHATSKDGWSEARWLPRTHVGSNMMRGLTDAQGWLVLPTHPVAQGERVPFLPLEW